MEDPKEKPQKRKFRPNIFDVFVIVIVVAVVGYALYINYRDSGGKYARNSVPMTYTVEFSGVTDGTLDCLKKGDEVYRSSDGVLLGTLVDIEYEPQKELWYSQAEEQYFWNYNDEYYDLYLTIETDGYSRPNVVYIGPVAARIGEAVNLKGPGYAMGGYIVGVNTKDGILPEDDQEAKGDQEVVYRLRATDMRDFVVDSLHVGDKMYDMSYSVLLGEIEDIEVSPMEEVVSDANGHPLKLEKTGRYTALITLRTRCSANDDGFYFLDGSVELKVGTTLLTTTRNLVRSLQVYDIIHISEVAGK